MATSADAEAALAKLLADALVGSLSPAVVKVIRGWPESNALDVEMAAGSVVASVHRLDVSRNTSRYLGEPASAVVPPPTLTASVSGPIATFVGPALPGQIAGVIANGIAYAVRTQPGDTPAAVVSRIATLMPGPALATGSTLMAAALTDARTAADGTAFREVGRQENTLQADIWCPTPDLRDRAEALVLPAIGAATFLPMPDGSRARLRIGAVMASDQASALTIYRLMVRATAEVTLSASEAAVIALWPQLSLNGGSPHLSS